MSRSGSFSGPGRTPEDWQAQVAYLEEEILELRRRLTDAPGSSRQLEQRLQDSQRSLSAVTSQNERLAQTLREARDQILTLKEEVDRLAQPPSGFGTFLMRQFFESVPDDFIHAARVDGLNEFEIFWKVALPLVTPALSALAIFTFLGNWTAFLWPLIVSSRPEMYTLPVGLAAFSGEFQTEWEMIMTGATVATLPTLLVFILFQRYIIRGVMLAGLKG